MLNSMSKGALSHGEVTTSVSSPPDPLANVQRAPTSSSGAPRLQSEASAKGSHPAAGLPFAALVSAQGLAVSLGRVLPVR